MKAYDFSDFPNVELIGVDLSTLDDDQLTVLYQQARYCQAMTDADTDTLREIVSPDAVFTHIASMKSTLNRWDEWLRRRFRMYIWKQWKMPKARIRNLMKLGIPRYYAHKWGYVKGYWRVAGSPVLTCSITNERLAQAGFYSLSDRYESLHLCG